MIKICVTGTSCSDGSEPCHVSCDHKVERDGDYESHKSVRGSIMLQLAQAYGVVACRI